VAVSCCLLLLLLMMLWKGSKRLLKGSVMLRNINHQLLLLRRFN